MLAEKKRIVALNRLFHGTPSMRECIKYAHDKPANYLLPCTVLNKLEMYRNRGRMDHKSSSQHAGIHAAERHLNTERGNHEIPSNLPTYKRFT